MAPVVAVELGWGSCAELEHDDDKATVTAAAKRTRRTRNDFTPPPYRIPLRGI
jgi:hypothetical protein